MIHFPATLRQSNSGALPKRTDSLNATQQKTPENKLFLKIEEELHDARRVHSHGQEEDLRLALNMTIERLSEVSSMLSEAYKAQADLEAQLHIAQSNLKLVISNNEMLEDALKRESSGGNTRDVGWRRATNRTGTSTSTHTPNGSEAGSRSSVEDSPAPEPATPSTSAASSPVVAAPATPAQETSRFFRFRFNTGSSSNAPTRPGTPQPGNTSSPQTNHLNSPSLPVLPSQAVLKEKERLDEVEKELENEKKARKDAEKAKEELEAELESLSQALFEEANKMVADERIKRADTEEELNQARLEKEALRSALRILESENEILKGSSSTELSPVITSKEPPRPSKSSLSISSSNLEEQEEQEVEVALGSSTDLKTPLALKRTSSQVALKSLPQSPEPASATATALAAVPMPSPAPPAATPPALTESPAASEPASLPPDAKSSSSLPLRQPLARKSSEFRTEEEEQLEREEEEIRQSLNALDLDADVPPGSDQAPSLSRKSTRDRPPSLLLDNYAMMGLGSDGASPWADVPSMSKSQAAKKSGESNFGAQSMRFNIV